MLWLNDQELNPAALPPSQLSVSYASGEQEVSIAPKELAELSESLLNRAAQVRASIDGPASRANVSNDNCPHCDVRHICSDYWTPAKGDASALADDIQLELKARRGDKTWSAECLMSNHFPSKTTLLLRWSLPNLVLLESLKPGMKVRLTGAMIFVDDSNECGIVNCVTNTDVIVLGI